MLGLLTRSRRPTSPRAPRSCRPSLEALELRDCPSTLTLNVAYGAGKSVTLYGQVTAGGAVGSSTPGFGGMSQLAPGGASSAAGVAGATVVFHGAATGLVTADSNGQFSFTTQAVSLGGEVDASTTDGQSNTASVLLSGGAGPVISNFRATQEGTSSWWDITGTVSDGNFNAAGLTVQVHGSPVSICNGGQGISGTVGADDTFCLVVKLNGTSSDNGTIDALVTDAWGRQSNDPMWTINQPGT
jgi:hypothetical protein